MCALLPHLQLTTCLNHDSDDDDEDDDDDDSDGDYGDESSCPCRQPHGVRYGHEI